jgi:IS6 family transposase
VLEALLPAAWHRTDRYASDGWSAITAGCRHGLARCAGLKQDGSARVVIGGHAFVQHLRRGYYELAVEEPVGRRVMVAFDELATAI